MAQDKSLHADEAVSKMKEIIGHVPVCLFQTRLSQRPISTRPMHTGRVDDQGGLWFLTSRISPIGEHIHDDPEVQLLYANHEGAEYLTISGKAILSDERGMKDELLASVPELSTELQSIEEGGADPEVLLIQVIPTYSYYWDATAGEGTALVRMMVEGVFGQRGQTAVEGELKIS